MKDAGDRVLRREPLDDECLYLPCLVEGLAGVSTLWGGPMPGTTPSFQVHFGIVIKALNDDLSVLIRTRAIPRNGTAVPPSHFSFQVVQDRRIRIPVSFAENPIRNGW